eukprot:scaffold49743_cov99-Phaeocystis_antarctica.AAC.3
MPAAASRPPRPPPRGPGHYYLQPLEAVLDDELSVAEGARRPGRRLQPLEAALLPGSGSGLGLGLGLGSGSRAASSVRALTCARRSPPAPSRRSTGPSAPAPRRPAPPSLGSSRTGTRRYRLFELVPRFHPRLAGRRNQLPSTPETVAPAPVGAPWDLVSSRCTLLAAAPVECVGALDGDEVAASFDGRKNGPG